MVQDSTSTVNLSSKKQKQQSNKLNTLTFNIIYSLGMSSATGNPVVTPVIRYKKKKNCNPHQWKCWPPPPSFPFSDWLSTQVDSEGAACRQERGAGGMWGACAGTESGTLLDPGRIHTWQSLKHNIFFPFEEWLLSATIYLLINMEFDFVIPPYFNGTIRPVYLWNVHLNNKSMVSVSTAVI